MSSVQLCEIHRSQSGAAILGGVDLQVEAGQYVVLLGPSGCGKTTLLKIMAGLVEADRGSVAIDGKSVDHLPPRKRDVSFVFQGDSLYPHLTIAESIAMGMHKMSAAQKQSRIDEACQMTGIGPLLNRRPEKLSGGELRRAAIAKSVARRCGVRLLDEPLSALDTHVRHGIQDALLAWHHTHRGTTIHVTHDGHEAMRVADRIAVLGDAIGGDGKPWGARVIQYANPVEIYDAPATKAVALSLGTPPISFVPATLRDGEVQSKTEGVVIRVPRREGDALNGEIDLGVRAEACQIAGDRDPGMDSRQGMTLSGNVSRTYFSNGRLFAELRIDAVCIAADITGQSVQSGQALTLHVPNEKLLAFDSQTGRSLG
ncbi:ABC transporter ATP-binding protein [Planctomycetes bacterium K23_9]|uniref:Maltose/maltodextrin import ATP-binding protein MalK n=1 Tax=Stieleria marina TaxID=1930275 RepID=A0A517NS60_9BACT|nr:Maltose/maltodextrin import ATP-binding protein MalK [Planctomycetes bacterium K23_9]